MPKIASATAVLCALTALSAAAGLSRAASGTEWQYCLAPSHADNKVYISQPFASDDLGFGDGQFRKALNRGGVSVDDIQCPRAETADAIAAMRRYAITFNRDSGNAVIFIRLNPVE
ncbi:MAG: hypothetical protein GC182_09835 [Rhodopseudomonas sp.]|nr:hypothetical protein [Rhodopseudomonas sp.]